MHKSYCLIAVLFFGLACNQSKQGPMTPPSPLIQKVLNHSDATKSKPATEEAIQALAARFKKPLPDKLLELWRSSDGVKFKRFYGKLLGPAESLEMHDQIIDELQWAGLLPILYDNQSNYVMLCMGEPIAPRVLYVPHDDGPRLLFRDLEAFFENLVIALDGKKDADSHYSESVGDYSREKHRTPMDNEVALELLEQPRGENNWNFAIDLLDESNLAAWKKVLETNHFVRRVAKARLVVISSPELKKLYADDQRDFAAFFDEFEKAAKDAGLPVGKRDDDSLNVGGHWINLDGLFHQRNEPRAMERMMNLCRDFIADRDPRIRPDYINKKIME